MLSAPIQSSSNASQVNSTANPLVTVVAINPTTTTADANSLLEKNAGSGSQAQLFAGQLDEALANIELVGTEVVNVESINVESIGAESIATETYGEQAILQNPEQSGFEQQDQKNQQQPNAEAWLQAMLDQQQLQLQARDSATSATTDASSAVVTMVAAEANSVTQATNAAIKTGVSAKVPQAVSAPGMEKFANANLVSSTLDTRINQTQVQADRVGQSPAVDKAFDAVAKAIPQQPAAAVAANNVSVAEVRMADVNNAANTAATLSSSASIVQLARAALSESNASESLSSGITPSALTSVGVDSAQRTVQSQLSLHAPEAKWGEQLLHALRDNVQVQIQQKIQNATIRLDPPELGSLEIYLSHESGRLQVQITASQADVARLIQHTSDRLRQELSGPQFTQVNIQTSAEGQSGQQQSRERQRFNGDELILANEQAFVGNEQQTKRPGDVLVTV